MAPALPLGNDFGGIVHIHGHVDGPTNGVIATDMDFSRAYLTEGWARRFLLALFTDSRKTVLFVGYSHDDLIVSYLARGLPTGGALRFALLPSTIGEGDVQRWEGLGIQPVTYASTGGADHENGAVALHEMAFQYVASKPSEHAERLRRLAGEGPADISDIDRAYLRFALRRPELVQKFLDAADTQEWAETLLSDGTLEEILGLVETGAPVAHWLANGVVELGSLLRQHLAQIAASGRSTPPALWAALVAAVANRRDELGADGFGRWVGLLLELRPADGGRHLSYLLKVCQLPDDAVTTFALLRVLLEPLLKVTPGFAWTPEMQVEPHARVELMGEEYWIRDYWETTLRPVLPSFAEETVALGVAAIDAATVRSRALGGGQSGWDGVSYERSSIATHSQDAHGGQLNLVVDMVRDAGLALQPDRDVASQLIAQPSILLQRIGLHVAAHDDKRTADQKLSLLLNHGLFNVGLHKHEAFELVRVAFREASDSMRERLWTLAVKWLTHSDPDHNYELYNFAVWLVGVDPEFGPAAEHKEAMEGEQGWMPRENPDFNSFMSSWSGQEEPPEPFPSETTPADVLDQIQNQHDGTNLNLGRVENTVAQRAAFGRALLIEAVERELWPLDLWKALIRSLLSHGLKDSWSTVAAGLDKHPNREELMWEVVASVRSLAEKSAPEAHSHLAGALADLLPIWAAAAPVTPDEESPSVDDVLYSWWGMIGDVIVHHVDMADKVDELDCAAAPLARFVEHFLVNDVGRPQLLGLSTALRNAAFLLSRCPDMISDLLRKVLADERVAPYAWEGLVFGQWSPDLSALIGPELAPFMPRASALSEVAQQKLTQQAAVVAVRADLWSNFGNPVDLLARVSRQLDASQLTADLARIFWRLPKDVESSRWEEVGKAYWYMRATGVPVAILPGECDQFVWWAVHRPEHLGDMVPFLRTMGAPRGNHGAFHEMAAEDWVDKSSPDAVAELLLYLLAHVESPRFLHRPDVVTTARRLLGNASTALLRDLAERMIELDVPGATAFKADLDGLGS